MYNARYRKGMKSQYGVENVAISGGGRVGLTRVVGSLGRVHLGHLLPDYTAYEELLEISEEAAREEGMHERAAALVLESQKARKMAFRRMGMLQPVGRD